MDDIECNSRPHGGEVAQRAGGRWQVHLEVDKSAFHTPLWSKGMQEVADLPGGLFCFLPAGFS